METVNNIDQEKIWSDKLKLNNKSQAEWQLSTRENKRKDELKLNNKPKAHTRVLSATWIGMPYISDLPLYLWMFRPLYVCL